MAVFDIRSNVLQIPLIQEEITSDVATVGTIVDNAHYELGLMFGLWGVDGSTPSLDGTYTLSLEESATGAFAGEEVAVATDKLIGDTPVVSTSNVGIIQTQGVFSNLRYVRPTVTSAGTTNGAAIVLITTEGAEHKPEQNDVTGD